MKTLFKILNVVTILVVLSSVVWALQISAVPVFTAQATAASQTSTSSAIDLRNIVNTGSFALHYTISGSGTAALYVSTSSTSTGTYVTYGTAIATGKTSGTYYTPFSPPVAPFVKILVTETGGAQSVTTTARLVVQ